MPTGLKSSPRLPCRKRKGCFCGQVSKRTRHQRAPTEHEAYQCSNLDLPPKRVPVPTPHCGTFGTPTRCFPRAIRKTLVRRFRRKTADLLTTVFTRRGSGETSGPSRPDASPSAGSDPARPNRRRTVQVENMRGLSWAQRRFPSRELIKCAGADDLRKSVSPRKRPSRNYSDRKVIRNMQLLQERFG